MSDTEDSIGFIPSDNDDDYAPVQKKATAKRVTKKATTTVSKTTKEKPKATKKVTKAKAKKTQSGSEAESSEKATKPKKTSRSKKAVQSTLNFTNGDEATTNGKESSTVAIESDSEPEVVAPSRNKSVDSEKAIEEIYQKKTQLEHILLRPDTYIGSVEPSTQTLWVYDSDKGSLDYRAVTITPGLYKIVDEILVNAADNKIRDPNMDSIKVTIDPEQNRISVYNSGKGIPIEIHKEEGVYVPELIFGHLLTSSNYNDTEKKVTGGRNGYGAKLCNIFSTEFIVETADKERGKKYKQVFRNNMSEKQEPVITKNTKKEEYTRITFVPDLAKFHMTSLDKDIVDLLKKRVYDMAGIVKNVKVWLNDERLKIKNFRQYVDLYLQRKEFKSEEGAMPKPVVHEIVNDRWEVAFTLSEGQFQQVSFANSVCTAKGGTHVNYIADQLSSRIIEVVKKKSKSVTVKPFQIKNHMWLFVNSLIENPSFDSQTKENMTLRTSAFGSKCELSEDFIKKVLKSGIVDSILSWTQAKAAQQLKKTDGHKTGRITGIVKLEDANFAGGRNSRECTLILTEGDSAKTLAVSGLSVVGRDYYGVFPLRGKLINVRDASHKSIMENQEINFVKQILGLQHGKSYSSVDSLRYGHIMIMTDQDHDGSHIKGLIINFFDHFFPSLLKIPGFLLEFITPIVKASKGSREIQFFTIPEYEAWKEANDNGRGWKIKYYKGLGTSTKEDARKYFSDLDLHRKVFKPLEDQERKLIDMAFSKTKADARKEWLRQFKPGTYIDHTVDEIAMDDFINRELILFSMADNARSIPSVVDGLKPGQRKIMFGVFKRNLKGEIKVAQLAGYVAEHSAYHHGEQSLTSTIVGLAQDFVGSNNINLLTPAGQFGSRLLGGKDAASARYIFTSIPTITRSIFNSSDAPLLSYQNEDGQTIEPEWYIPIIPVVLVNGSEGIGTGWSSYIPNFNPEDIVTNLRRMMSGQSPEPMQPWFRGFKGVIEKQGDRYKVSGIIRKLDDTTVEITELPIRTWTQSYKELLESWVMGTEKTPAWVQTYSEYHTDTTVHFKITLTPENMQKAEAEGLERRFKLSSYISATNMVCFDSEGRLKRYGSVLEILEEFYYIRLKHYQLRKELLVDQLTQEVTKLNNRVRFIEDVRNKVIILHEQNLTDIVKILKKRGYTPFPKNPKKNSTAEEEESDAEGEGEESAHGYEYLLDAKIRSLTPKLADKLKGERDAKQKELDILIALTPRDLWNTDLDKFLEEWRAKLQLDQLNEKRLLEEATKSNVKRKQKKTTKAKTKGKKKVVDDEDDLSDDEYVPETKKSRR